ncbi:SRPBCC family protein [Streptomyces sp. 5K101]|uniref:SRPBCC family protein n=1 Tax=Streptomyces sp. 5K101 TaxID=3390037 RepID=UPI003974BB79
MSTLEEHVDIDVPLDFAWERLHRVETYPRFVKGIRQARPENGDRAHLDVDTAGTARELDARITDRVQEHTMEWRTTGGPDLAATLSLLPLDAEHTRLQARIAYDPGTVREAFGGPKGFAQATAIERLLRDDLDHFKELVEQER